MPASLFACSPPAQRSGHRDSLGPSLLALTALAFVAVLALAPSASAAVLYDQTTGVAGGFVTSLENPHPPASPGETVEPCGIAAKDTSCFAIDDFTVPAGLAWYIKNIHVDGQGGTGDSFAWSALESDGLPAAPPQGGSPFEIDWGGPSAFAAGISGAPETGSNDFDIGVGEGTALPTGHYWLSVYANSVDASGISGPPPTAWAWQTQAPASGASAAWSARQCDANAQYASLPACGQPGPDLRFRIEGEVLDSSFSGLTVGKARRTPDGGVNIPVELKGPPERPGVVVKKVKGKGKIYAIAKEGWAIVKGKPAPSKLGPNDEVPVVVKVRPAGATATALKAGKKIKMVLSISYARRVNSLSAPISIPAGSAKVKVLLKKVR